MLKRLPKLFFLYWFFFPFDDAISTTYSPFKVDALSQQEYYSQWTMNYEMFILIENQANLIENV